MKTLLLAASFAALSIARPVAAQPAAGSLVVSTAGLDLATVRGQRALDLRILHAVSALCGTPSPADARGRVRFDACRANAVASATLERDRAVAMAERRSDVQIALTR
jgi:UrcA family protein